MVKNNEKIYLEENYIVLSLPTETVEIEIIAKVYHDGELINVKKTLSIQEVRDGFKEAEEGYIPLDAEFQVTEKGLEYLEELDG